MRVQSVRYLIFTILLCISAGLVYGWGFWAHQRINRSAVFSLPEDMRRFYYNHIDFISEEAVMPDVRIYAINDKAEANRHYIDMEYLRKSPAETIPPDWKDARAKYKDSLLQESGILPWYIDSIMTKLTKAFRDKDKAYILFLSGDLAHYIGDAHVPLHTTANHNGQLTGQRGIHSFWESFLTERFGSNYNLYTGNAVAISDTKKEIWRIIESSHKLVDTLLSKQRALNASFPADQMFQKDAEGNIAKNKFNQNIYSIEYAKKYHESLNGMVENQMRLAIAATGNFWYTAWVNAGRPNLNDLDPEELTKRNNKHYKSDLKRWRKGQVFGLKTSREF
jgi:hypothetical protein